MQTVLQLVRRGTELPESVLSIPSLFIKKQKQKKKYQKLYNRHHLHINKCQHFVILASDFLNLNKNVKFLLLPSSIPVFFFLLPILNLVSLILAGSFPILLYSVYLMP
jgi:hypothetical protein